MRPAISTLDQTCMNDKKKQNGRRKPHGNAFEIGVITISSRPAPDARDRLRRIITMMIKHAARDRQSETERDDAARAEGHAEEQG